MKDKNFEEYRNLGLALFFFRRQRGLTQQQVADTIDVSYETISRIENANTGISFDMLLALSRALDTPLSEIFKQANL